MPQKSKITILTEKGVVNQAPSIFQKFIMNQTTSISPKSIIMGIVAVLCLIVLFNCFTQVKASKIGVVTSFGKIQDNTLNEGLHMVAPWWKINQISVGVNKATVKDAEAASKDLQTVSTTLTLNYSVQRDKVKQLYAMSPAMTYVDDYIDPAVYEVFKAVVSKYSAEQLVISRQTVSDDIHKTLTTKLQQYGIDVRDINITSFDFSREFNRAIEEKVTATQNAEKAQRDLQRIQYEAQQKVAQAEGEAQAISIQAQAIKTNGGTEYLQLQAINKWDGKLPVYMTPNSPMPFIGVK
jgi:regulator of protease activity HflC (stomatin/prohibitin superfamily)